MKISIIIVAWNNCTELKDCLESLKSQTAQGFEVIVIDNCSSDGTPEMVREVYPEAVISVMESNLGFAEGCNRGILLASGEWLCTLNSDAVVESDWIEKVSNAIHHANLDVGMFQTKVLFRKNPNRINSAGIVLLATGSSGDRGLNAPDSNDDGIEEIFVPSASAAVYRKKMLMEARLDTGFFDRTFFMYSEDLDLGWRCRLMGWKAMYLPDARVFHGYQSSSIKWGKKWADLQCRKNRIRTLLKNSSVQFLIFTIPKTAYDLLIGLRYSGFRAFNEFYKAIRDGVTQRKHVTEIMKTSRRRLEKRWVTKAIRIKQY